MLGIDVSKQYLVAALFDRATEQFHWDQRTVPNTEAGIRQLLALTPTDCPWVLEPTGRYSTLAAQLARAAGRTVWLAPPKKAKDYLASISTRAKTDRLDGRGLALFGASRTAANPLPAYPLKSPPVEHLDQLLTARRGLVDALTRLKQQAGELPHAREWLQRTTADLKTRLQELDAEIARHTAKTGPLPQAAKLRRVPGIGPVTAAAAASRLTSRNFDTADQWVAYLGLDVAVVQSGQRQGQRGLSKQGDAYLRRLFYLAAVAHVKSKDSPYRELFQAHVARGRPKIAAYNIVARKLARLCWSLLKHDQAYDPARVRQPANPPRPAAPALAAAAPPIPPETRVEAPEACPSVPPVRPPHSPRRRVRLGSRTGVRPANKPANPPNQRLTGL